MLFTGALLLVYAPGHARSTALRKEGNHDNHKQINQNIPVHAQISSICKTTINFLILKLGGIHPVIG
jgi:hypothetical protein